MIDVADFVGKHRLDVADLSGNADNSCRHRPEQRGPLEQDEKNG